MQQDMPPVGFRFLPADDELVGRHLHPKLMPGDRSVQDTLPEIDVCKNEPWDLPAVVSSRSRIKSDDPEWFFFSPRDYKFSNSSRSNRATSCGYWKATGKDRKIWDRVTNNVIGTKKILVFYRGRHPGVKTNWVIHEYHDALSPSERRTHVLCKLLKKPGKTTQERTDELVNDENEPNHNLFANEYESPANGYMIREVDSTIDDEHEEFDYRSFLCLSPSKDEN